MQQFRRHPFWFAICVGTAVSPAWAGSGAPEVVPGTTNLFLDNRSANDVGISAGEHFQFGAEIVGGSAGVTITGTAATGYVSGPAKCGPLSVNADFCAWSAPYKSTRLDPWTIAFARDAAVTTVTTPSLTGVTAVPFPVSVTLSGHGLTPTLTWSVPGGFVPDGFRVNVYDKGVRLANGTDDIIYSGSLSPSTPSFTLPSSIGLSTTGSYSINFQLIETRGGVPFGPGDGNQLIFSRSSSFFDFAPLTGSAPTDVALPTIDSSGVYNFHVDGVDADHITFVDPAVAIGYRYAIGAGDPDFKSVLLPDIGDGEYTLTYTDSTGTHSVSLAHDEQYFFGDGGVAAFTVTGIETAAGLDPGNGTAFVTGLSFESAGDFTGTMTPITTSVAGAVPEPAMGVLLLVGLGVLGATRARERRAGS